MARIRTIKPEFWSDEKLAECSLGARLLFIATWNFADDEGRMEYSPKRLKMQAFPGDDVDVTPLVAELARRKLVIVYQVANREYLAIPNFRKHQRIDRPRPSKLPDSAQVDSGNIPQSVMELPTTDTETFDESSKSARRMLDERSRRNGRERNGKEGNKTNTSKPSVYDDYLACVLQVWDYYITTIGRNPKLYSLTDKRKRMGVARVRDLWPRVVEPKQESVIASMKICVDRLAASPFHNGENKEGKKYVDWEHLFRSTEQMEKWLNDVGGRK